MQLRMWLLILPLLCLHELSFAFQKPYGKIPAADPGGVGNFSTK